MEIFARPVSDIVLPFQFLQTNANAALVFEFCYRLINVGRSYFGRLDEESVKGNFVLIYELLDGESERQWLRFRRVDCSTGRVVAEILDFGYPQNSETDTLKMYITTEGVKSEQAVVRPDSLASSVVVDGWTNECFP